MATTYKDCLRAVEREKRRSLGTNLQRPLTGYEQQIVYGLYSFATFVDLGKGVMQKRNAHIKRAAARMGLIKWACMSLFTDYMSQLTPEAQEALLILVRIKSVLLPVYVVHVCAFFILRAGGDTMSTLIIDSGFLWAGPVLISTVLSMFTPIGLVPLFFFVQSLDLFKVFVALWLLKKGRWVRNLAVE